MITPQNELSDERLQSIIKTLSTLFYAFLFGIFSMLAIMTYLIEVEKSRTTDPELTSVFMYIIPILSLINIFASKLLFNQTLSKAKNAIGQDRFAHYQTAYLIRWALLEGSSLFCIVVYFVTGTREFLLILAILVGFMIMTKPSISKFKEEMGQS